MDRTINLNGRKLINSNFDQKSDCIVSKFTYNDGTILEFIQKADNIKVNCNKNLQVNPDGTVDII